MATISLTDGAGIVADIAIRDDSPLAKAKATRLILAAASLAGDFESPIDQINFSRASFGGNFSDPSALVAGATNLAVNATACGAISVVRAADKFLFGGDDLSLDIPISADQCWVGVELDGSLGAQISAATPSGFGVGVGDSASISFATYTLVHGPGGSFPSLASALPGAIENFGVTLDAASIAAQKPGTVNVTDVTGTVTFSGSYSLPVDVKPLASATLPVLQYGISVTPSTTVEISGQIALTGEFSVRAHKVSPNELRLGVYKKKGVSLTVAFTANAGLQALHKTTDLASTILGAAFGAADIENDGISGDQAGALQAALNRGLDHSLSAGVNLECSASDADEAAIVYAIDLSQGDSAKTFTALTSALKGDWTALDGLPNAQALRHVLRNTKDFQHRIGIHLLGIYNAVSVADFARSCTILHDGNGEIVITDRVTASRVAASTELYRADPDKLEAALADGFLATATYLSASGRIDAAFTASQSYLFYADQLDRAGMKTQLLLLSRLGLLKPSELDAILSTGSTFSHVRLSATAAYPDGSALRLFLSNVGQRAPFTAGQLESTGRSTMASLINPAAPGGPTRIRILASDAAWKQMDSAGAVASFGTLDELRGLNANELADAGADWVDVRWWSDSMLAVGRALADVFTAIEAAGSAPPDQNQGFMAARQRASKALADASKKTHAAFCGGWGFAVMNQLAGGAAALTVELMWDSNARHYSKPAAAQAADSAG